MGICESANHGKSLDSYNKQKEDIISQSDQTIDYQNSYQDQSGVRPSIFSKTENNNSTNQDIQIIEKPELMTYDRSRSLFYSGKKSETNTFSNITSIHSSAKSEEEIIIRGEIDTKTKHKDEEFVNNSFKKEVKNHGGIIIKSDDLNNTRGESQKSNSFSDMGLENISEIHSSAPSQNNRVINNNNSNMYLSTIKGYNDNILKRKNNPSNNSEGIMNGSDQLIKNNNNIQYNGRYNINNYINGMKNSSKTSSTNSKLNQSNKINVSLNDSCPRKSSYLNVPKIDVPLPDIEEISEKE